MSAATRRTATVNVVLAQRETEVCLSLGTLGYLVLGSVTSRAIVTRTGRGGVFVYLEMGDCHCRHAPVQSCGRPAWAQSRQTGTCLQNDSSDEPQ